LELRELIGVVREFVILVWIFSYRFLGLRKQ
jgi:hypothetical protein